MLDRCLAFLLRQRHLNIAEQITGHERVRLRLALWRCRA